MIMQRQQCAVSHQHSSSKVHGHPVNFREMICGHHFKKSAFTRELIEFFYFFYHLSYEDWNLLLGDLLMILNI